MSFSPSSPPFCYGKSYDNDSRACASCALNNPCRQEIIRVAFVPQYQAPVPPALVNQPAPYQPYQPYQPAQYAAPPQYQAPPWLQKPTMPPPPTTGYRIPVQTAPVAPTPVQQVVQAAVQQIMQGGYSPIGIYGAIPDPAIAMLSSIPPIFRPQMQGESFWMRVLKNLGARLIEVLLDEAKIAVRQAVFPPPPPAPVTAAQMTVEAQRA